MLVWQPNSPLGGLPMIKNARSLRESSYDKTGGQPGTAKTIRA